MLSYLKFALRDLTSCKISAITSEAFFGLNSLTTLSDVCHAFDCARIECMFFRWLSNNLLTSVNSWMLDGLGTLVTLYGVLLTIISHSSVRMMLVEVWPTTQSSFCKTGLSQDSAT
jgi:hypothetical protein